MGRCVLGLEFLTHSPTFPGLRIDLWVPSVFSDLVCSLDFPCHHYDLYHNPGVVPHICDSSTQEAEAGGL
jgi:hypothetical protein